MSLEQDITKWLGDAEKALVNNYKSFGLRASGNWERELESKIEKSQFRIKASILGAKYTGAINEGRKANLKQDDQSIRAFVGWAGSTFLDKWVKDKGISVNPFAVAYKIAREGVKVPNKYNAGNFVDKAIDDKMVQSLIDIVKFNYELTLKSEIIGALKNGN